MVPVLWADGSGRLYYQREDRTQSKVLMDTVIQFALAANAILSAYGLYLAWTHACSCTLCRRKR
jgi:hypothetical protein